MSRTQKRVLRVGILQAGEGGRLVEERLFSRPQRITVGQAPRNTLAVPLSRLPLSFTVFEVESGRQLLRFVRGMEGRVSVGDEVIQLKDLAKRGLAERRGDHFVYPLGPESRGRVVLGDISVLFQFVAATQEAPPPDLAVPRQRWWRRLDKAFGFVLLVSFLVQAGLVGGLEWWWITTGQFEKKIRPRPRILEPLLMEVEIAQPEDDDVALADLALAAGADEEPEDAFDEEPENEPTLEDLEIRPETAKTERLPSDGKPRDAEEDKRLRYERQVANVRKNTLIRYLTSAGPGDDSRFSSGLSGAAGKKLADAWSAEGGVALADAHAGGGGSSLPATAPAGDGGAGYRKLSGKKQYGGAIRTAEVKAPEKQPEVAVRGKVRGKLGGKTGIGEISGDSVASVFRRRQSAIRRCYEKSLRTNPDLEGKVTIRFTIGPAGRITSISVVQDTTGDSAIGRCIVSRVRGWRFSPPRNGSVTFSYPFILSRG